MKEPTLTGYEKIRKHVMGIIFKSGPEPKRLMSSRDMAKDFGVTHMTVARVLKDLADDGYLVARPGVGTFTNPRNSKISDCSKIFGVITGDGKNAFVERIQLQMTSAFVNALLYRSQSHSVQHCPLVSSLKNADVEIAKEGFDGLIWICPPAAAAPAIRRLKEGGLAIVCAGKAMEGVSSTFYDFKHDNRQVAKLMLQEGRRKLMLLHPASSAYGIAGMEDAYSEEGLKFDRSWAFSETDETQEAFGRILEAMKPDGIIFNVSIGPYMKEVKEHLDIVTECRLYSGEWALRKDMGFYGYEGVADLTHLAELAADNLEAQIAMGKDAPILHEGISFKIEMAGEPSRLDGRMPDAAISRQK